MSVTSTTGASPTAKATQSPPIERSSISAPTKIIVDPRFNAYRYGFYLLGLRSAFRRTQIVYSLKPFLEAPVEGLAFVLCAPKEHRVFICAEDGCNQDERVLDWCDVYGKVNLNTVRSPESSACRVVPLGPSFAVRVWSLLRASSEAARTWMYTRPFGTAAREHFANYWRQYHYRLPESSYRRVGSSSTYVFFASSLWKKESQTNEYRRRFIEVARQCPEITFEGGFAPRTRNDLPGFHDLTLTRRYSFTEYFSKMQASAVAFNTPAVLGCHGWKLGEFLALGKAIISTPLTRLLPAPLIHARHIHYVDGSRTEIERAIRLICLNADYRKSLESAARQYYDDYLAPHRVIERLLVHVWQSRTDPAVCELPLRDSQ